MRKTIAAALASLALVAVIAAPVAADTLSPCNDADGSGSPSGREYAAHHITQLARAGMLGGEEHTPGGHQGFSLCLGVH
jgi:hypothetical protein